MTATGTLSQVTELATNTAHSAWGAASDFLILLVLIGALFLFAYYVGRGPFVALLLAFYSAYAVYVAFPYDSLLPTAPVLTALLSHAGFYLGLTVVFYIILRRVVVSDFLYIGIFGLIALSFLGAAFLIAMANHVFLITSVYEFTPPLVTLFTPDKYFFWWFIAPAVGLFFLAR